MIKVAALYQFLPFPDYAERREPLRAFCVGIGLKGSILLAKEGINGTVAGAPDAIDALSDELRRGNVLGRPLDNLEIKFSSAGEMPFQRLKIRLKKEIVTLGDNTDPLAAVGTYVDPRDWNSLIASEDVLVIDTRNDFEVAMGTFEGAIDPRIAKFSAFREYVSRELDAHKHRRIAMFCTGGIRCEKASSYLLAQGFENVYHLKGGILGYLESVPASESRWTGDCFVFDGRVALGHGLVERSKNEAAQG